jgi:hypothetical protein
MQHGFCVAWSRFFPLGAILHSLLACLHRLGAVVGRLLALSWPWRLGFGILVLASGLWRLGLGSGRFIGGSERSERPNKKTERIASY